MRVLASFIAIALATPPCSAAAQAPPLGLNLNGIWELSEHGQTIAPRGTLVEIIQSGSTVVATFILGHECYDHTPRAKAFTGRLSVRNTPSPQYLLEADDMWVCSGDSALVKKCGPPITSNYITSFKNAKTEPDLIEGNRVTQGVKDCQKDPSENGTAEFTLRRLLKCELEMRRFAAAESDLRDLQTSLLISHEVFGDALSAAGRVYGSRFRGLPIDNLRHPFATTNVEDDLLMTRAFFIATPGLFTSADWTNAKTMARNMSSDTPPLPEAALMLEHLNRIEAMAAAGRQTAQAYEAAEAALRACTP